MIAAVRVCSYNETNAATSAARAVATKRGPVRT
jgi:hypothetical protein